MIDHYHVPRSFPQHTAAVLDCGAFCCITIYNYIYIYMCILHIMILPIMILQVPPL